MRVALGNIQERGMRDGRLEMVAVAGTRICERVGVFALDLPGFGDS